MTDELGQWTAQNLPEHLVGILDGRAGKVHSPTGVVRETLAQILNAYDSMFVYDEDPEALLSVWDRKMSTVDYVRHRTED